MRMKKQSINGLMVDEINKDLLSKGWHLNTNGYAVNGIHYVDIRGKPRFKSFIMHRVIMERSIKRPLLTSEQVWHHNKNLVDNRMDNLYIVERKVSNKKDNGK